MTQQQKMPLAIHYGRTGTTRIDERQTPEGIIFAVTKTLSEKRGTISRSAKDEALARHIFATLSEIQY